MSKGWAKEEVECIVADYFKMLLAELEGKSFNKAKHRKALLPLLANRSMGSIEFKHQNISAVMIDLGLPYIDGYKPRGNYQWLLKKMTETMLESFPNLLEAIRSDVEKSAELEKVDNILEALVLPPVAQTNSMGVCENQSSYGETNSRFVKINYLEREARNSSLGAAGEKFVLEFEKTRLTAIEKPDLADQIEQISETRGDWAGYDIRSFNDNGSDRFIEVKTTRYGIETPFFVTKNELGFSTKNSSDYNLYRVFSFRKSPKLFMLQGRLDKVCTLDAVHFRARV